MLDFKEGQTVCRNERNFEELHGETGVIAAIMDEHNAILVRWDSDNVTTLFIGSMIEKIDILETFFDETDSVI
jgi:hypothetical protein